MRVRGISSIRCRACGWELGQACGGSWVRGRAGLLFCCVGDRVLLGAERPPKRRWAGAKMRSKLGLGPSATMTGARRIRSEELGVC